ncbi:MAG: hypothetical protein LAN18_05065 [Acidobacteriia bacterium]|nr:hypothetical protein [Terriglobia bacterium]
MLDDLHAAAEEIAMLVCCVHKWIPEDKEVILADELRPHLQAAFEILKQYAEKYRELIDHNEDDDRMDEVVDMSLDRLSKAFTGRRFGIRPI